MSLSIRFSRGGGGLLGIPISVEFGPGWNNIPRFVYKTGRSTFSAARLSMRPLVVVPPGRASAILEPTRRAPTPAGNA